MKIGGICGECHKYYRGDSCPKCAPHIPDRTLNFISDFHEEYYDHGLGQVIRTRQERKQVMKEKGLVEVGNERSAVDHRKRDMMQKKQWDKTMEGVNRQAYQMLGAPEWN